MGHIEDVLIHAFSPALFRGEKVSADLRNIIGHIVKRGRLGIPDPPMLEEHAYNTFKAARVVPVGSLLGVTNLNYSVHKVCICRAGAYGRKQREILEKLALT